MESGNLTDKGCAGEILLIGEAAGVFSDADERTGPAYRLCANMVDGIEAAARGGFAAVAVVMGGTAGNLRSALSALRKNTAARIVLLVRMYDEPRAMELTGAAGDGASLADDYIICPVQMDRFQEAVRRDRSATGGDAAGGAAEAVIEARVSRLEKLATEDDLTGLKNRRYILEFSRQIIERAKKDRGRVTLLVFDIDNFKHYNDEYGHRAGDEVLRQAAVMMRRCCRRHDVVARIGGDEFAVVFWDDPRCRTGEGNDRRASSAEHPNEVLTMARRFRKEVESAELPLLGPEGKGVLTISGGLASVGRDGWTTEELFAQADKALLEAKRSGKNRIYLVGEPENDIDKIQ